MLRNTLQILILLIPILSFSQKIKSITEFKLEKDTKVKLRESSFDKKGNLTNETTFGNYDEVLETYRNKNKILSYENGRVKSEILCEYFVKQDTCVVRSFKKFDYDSIMKTETITMFEADSSVRFIQHIKKEKKVKFIKTYSWEFFPIKNIDYKKATVLTDTIIYDQKRREIKRTHYNSFGDKHVEIYKYSKNTYLYQTIGEINDTIITYDYSKLQKLIHNKKIDYRFNDLKIYSYVIEYY